MAAKIPRDTAGAAEAGNDEPDGGAYAQPHSLSDVVLVAEGRRLHYSRAVLGYASPVWTRMFEGEFREKGAEEIPLPGKTYAQVEAFLLCIDPGKQNAVTDENVELLSTMAEEYQMELLKSKCDETLISKLSSTSTIDEIIEIVKFAELYRLPNSVTAAATALSHFNVNELEKSLSGADLSGTTLAEIYKSRAYAAELENKNHEVYEVLRHALSQEEYSFNHILKMAIDHKLFQYAYSMQHTAKILAPSFSVSRYKHCMVMRQLSDEAKGHIYLQRAMYLDR